MVGDGRLAAHADVEVSGDKTCFAGLDHQMWVSPLFSFVLTGSTEINCPHGGELLTVPRILVFPYPPVEIWQIQALAQMKTCGPVTGTQDWQQSGCSASSASRRILSRLESDRSLQISQNRFRSAWSGVIS